MAFRVVDRVLRGDAMRAERAPTEQTHCKQIEVVLIHELQQAPYAPRTGDALLLPRGVHALLLQPLLLLLFPGRALQALQIPAIGIFTESVVFLGILIESVVVLGIFIESVVFLGILIESVVFLGVFIE